MIFFIKEFRTIVFIFELRPSLKDVVRSSMNVPEFDKHLKKANRLKRCGNNNKDEDNSPKILYEYIKLI